MPLRRYRNSSIVPQARKKQKKRKSSANFSLQNIVDISQIAQTALVVISLFFVWYQLREGVRFARAENARSLVEHSSSFNSLLIQDSELTTLWYTHGKEIDQASPTNRARYREMLVQWLIFHENIYYQNKKNLLDEEVYDAWLADLSFTVENHDLAIISDEIEDFFPGDFGKHLKELSAKQSR